MGTFRQFWLGGSGAVTEELVTALPSKVPVKTGENTGAGPWTLALPTNSFLDLSGGHLCITGEEAEIGRKKAIGNINSLIKEPECYLQYIRT